MEMGKREREGAGRAWGRCALLMAALAFAGVAVVTGRPSLAAELPAVEAVERLAAKAPGMDAVERLAAMRPGADAVERLAAKGAVVEMAGAQTVPPIDARQLAALPARYI